MVNKELFLTPLHYLFNHLSVSVWNQVYMESRLSFILLLNLLHAWLLRLNIGSLSFRHLLKINKKMKEDYNEPSDSGLELEVSA